MGKQINVTHLSEKQLKVLDWGLSQKNLSMHDIDNQKLEDIIANLTVVYDYEQA